MFYHWVLKSDFKKCDLYLTTINWPFWIWNKSIPVQSKFCPGNYFYKQGGVKYGQCLSVCSYQIEYTNSFRIVKYGRPTQRLLPTAHSPLIIFPIYTIKFIASICFNTWNCYSWPSCPDVVIQLEIATNFVPNIQYGKFTICFIIESKLNDWQTT